MKKRPKLLAFIIILIVIGGVWKVVTSIPFYSLYISLKQGGLTVSGKVNIHHVQPNTPASEAQLMRGDTIISINGKRITSTAEFVSITNANQGKEITVVIEREGNTQTVYLVPRVNHPPNEGRLGIVLSNTAIEKKSTVELIPQVILRSYAGYEEGPAFLFTTLMYQDKNLTRLRSLAFGIINIAVGIGLWKWKRWAFNSYFILVGFGLLLAIPYLTNPVNYIPPNKIQSVFYTVRAPNLTDTVIYIIGLVVGILVAYYVFRQRKLFK